MSNKKSAKDVAFEKERAKFRQEIRELQREIKKRDADIYELKESLKNTGAMIETKDDWIRRLLEYTELSEEEMKKIILKDKIDSEISHRVDGVFRGFSSLFNHPEYVNLD